MMMVPKTPLARQIRAARANLAIVHRTSSIVHRQAPSATVVQGKRIF